MEGAAVGWLVPAGTAVVSGASGILCILLARSAMRAASFGHAAGYQTVFTALVIRHAQGSGLQLNLLHVQIRP
jgi:hypothetical protein